MTESSQPALCRCYPQNLVELANTRSNRRLSCKFVVIVEDGRVNVVIGPIDNFKYHANLVERFCVDSDIPWLWAAQPDRVEILDRLIKVRGGGAITLDAATGNLRVYGESKAYGSFEPAPVRSALDNCPHLGALSLLIDV